MPMSRIVSKKGRVSFSLVLGGRVFLPPGAPVLVLALVLVPLLPLLLMLSSLALVLMLVPVAGRGDGGKVVAPKKPALI